VLKIIDRIPEFQDQRIGRLFDYWCSLADRSAAPARRLIDPLQFSWILPFVWLYEHEPETGRFRCRLAGEDIADRYDFSIKGMCIDEFLQKDAVETVQEQYLKVISLPGIGHSIGRVYLAGLHRPGIGERVFFPLCNDEGDTCFVFGATIYSAVSDNLPADTEETIIRTITPLSTVWAELAG
jgi:hypothetical protein